MTLNPMPYAQKEVLATTVPAAPTADVYTTGAIISSQAYEGGVDVIVVESAPGGMDIDIIVQTSLTGTGSSARWADTGTRLNNVTTSDTFRIPIADPILNQVRLRIIRNAGSTALTVQPIWLADSTITLL